jgi:hypothetical protein
VPAGFHAGGDVGEHLHDLSVWDRRWLVLDLGALEFECERVAAFAGVCYCVGRHV